MKKLILFALVLALVVMGTSVFALEFQVGALVENPINPIGLLDVRADFGLLTIEAAAGFGMITLANPTVTINGSPYTIPDISLNAYVIPVEAGVYLNWWRPPNMVVYSGARVAFTWLIADFYLDDVTTTIDANFSGNIWSVKALVLGWDWKIPGVPNAVFTAGVGAQWSWPANLTGTIGSESAEVDPGLDILNTFVEFGVRVALGGDPQGTTHQ